MKKELMKFMQWMAVNDKKPWQNYEEVVNEYLRTIQISRSRCVPPLGCDEKPNYNITTK